MFVSKRPYSEKREGIKFRIKREKYTVFYLKSRVENKWSWSGQRKLSFRTVNFALKIQAYSQSIYSDRLLLIQGPYTLNIYLAGYFPFEGIVSKKKLQKMKPAGRRPEGINKTWTRLDTFRHQIIFTSSSVHQIFKYYLQVSWRTTEDFLNLHKDWTSWEDFDFENVYLGALMG